MRRAMPSRPAATVAAKTRYGLASAPGMRHSTRSDEQLPTMRNPAVRLSIARAIAVGANEPARKRLYEFTVGAKSSAQARACCISPPNHHRQRSGNRSDSADPPADLLRGWPALFGGAPAAGANAAVDPPSRQRLECTCIELPARRSSSLAMKVTACPFWMAISLAACL